MGARKPKAEMQILCRLCNEWFPESKASAANPGLCPRCAIGRRLDRNQSALDIRRARVAELQAERETLLAEEKKINAGV